MAQSDFQRCPCIIINISCLFSESIRVPFEVTSDFIFPSFYELPGRCRIAASISCLKLSGTVKMKSQFSTRNFMNIEVCSRFVRSAPTRHGLNFSMSASRFGRCFSMTIASFCPTLYMNRSKRCNARRFFGDRIRYRC